MTEKANEFEDKLDSALARIEWFIQQLDIEQSAAKAAQDRLDSIVEIAKRRVEADCGCEKCDALNAIIHYDPIENKSTLVENRDHKSERKTFRDPAKTAVERQAHEYEHTCTLTPDVPCAACGYLDRVESQKQFGLSRWDRPEVKAEEAEKTAAMRGRVDALLDATCEHGKKVREWCDECEKALGRV
jgi:hypothetical protein